MKRRFLLIPLCILFAAITGFYGLRLYRDLHTYSTGAETYEALTQYVAPVTTEPPAAIPLSHTPEETEPTEEVDDTLWPQVDFESLQAINPDIVAWVTIEGTNIHYPVVQGPDNDYYLDHLFDGRESGVGSIFMDYRNAPDLSGRNTVLYGHNLKDGTMLNQITNYNDQSFYEQHPRALLMTPEKNYMIEFVAGYITDPNGPAWKMEFASDWEFSLWLEDRIPVAKGLFPPLLLPVALA